MIRLLLIFTTTYLFGQNNFDKDFITQFEYGKMLYNNPRGISCAKCHGKDAKGKIIANFQYTKEKKKFPCSLKSNDITNISYEKFLAKLDPKLNKKKESIQKDQICKKLTYGNSMPTYFLTQEELKSIYFYLTNKDKYE